MSVTSIYNAILNTVFSDEDLAEPVTLAEAKAWCRIDVADEDVLITDLITSARQACENYVNLSFVTRTIDAVIESPNGYIKLPYGPVKTLITVKDEDGATLTYKENYSGIKIFAVFKAFVKYEAGFTILPIELKIALYNQILFMYENRGDAQKISPATLAVLKPLRNV